MKYVVSFISFFWCLKLLATVNSNFTVTSDYVWRGVSQSAHEAAVQGGMDFALLQNLSVGTWLSNVQDKGAEVDFYGDYEFLSKDFIKLSIGLLFFHYTKSGSDDTLEYVLKSDTPYFQIFIHYSDDHFGSSTGAWYTSMEKEINLSKQQNISLFLHLGHTNFDEKAWPDHRAFMTIEFP